MRNFKILSLLLGICVALLVSACASPVTKKADPKEAVTNAYQKLVNLRSYHMTADITSTIKVKDQTVNTTMQSEMDVQQKPMLFKNTMNITAEGGSQKSEQKVIQYAEQSGKQLMIYSNVNNQWVKQAMDLAEYDPLKDFDNYIKAIISVTQKSEDGTTVTYEVIAGGNYLKDNIQRNMASIGMKNVPITDELIKNIGDFKYTVTIDKKTSTISKLDMDMSDIMAKLGDVLAESKDVPENQKQTVKDLFKNMKVTSMITLSQFDSIGSIVIPAEAKQ